MVESFSDTSSLHREYTMRTSDGFRGIFYQDSPHVQSIIDELTLQFSTLVKKCSACFLNHDHRLYTKEYVDKVHLPSLLLREEEGGVHSFGDTLLGYIEAARDGMYKPLVKYCIAFAFPRIQICYLIQMATIKRAKTHMQVPAYYKGYIALIQSNGPILEDVKRFIYSLMRWKMYPILDRCSFNNGSYPPKTLSSDSDTSSDTENQSGPQTSTMNRNSRRGHKSSNNGKHVGRSRGKGNGSNPNYRHKPKGKKISTSNMSRIRKVTSDSTSSEVHTFVSDRTWLMQPPTNYPELLSFPKRTVSSRAHIFARVQRFK